MPVTELNHYFVRANDLERTKDFYCEVLGFEVMPRPGFPFPGDWPFLATDPEAFAQRFDRLGIKPRNRYFPEFKLDQSFIRDPDGLMIELNFHGVEKEPNWGDSESYAEMRRVADVAK